MSKQTATINDWRLIRTPSGSFALQGHITNHVRQDDFDGSKFQQTSTVILFDPVNKKAETLNTYYTLGNEYKSPEDDHVEALNLPH